jgi:photosystem II stability/assembly factor-like uncharacterized protein
VSFVKEHLGSITRFLLTALLLTFLSVAPVQAAPSFGTSTSVNTSGLSTFGFNGMTATPDGSKLLVATGNGYLLYSSDSGTTWSAMTSAGARNWAVVAINDSGTVMVAGETGGYLYMSTNSGATWAQANPGVANWAALDMNSSGTVIAATYLTGVVMISTNSGVSWVNKTVTGSTANKGVFVSSVGDKISTFSTSSGYVYLSSDTGTTFVGQTSAGVGYASYPAFWSSRDGQKIVYQKTGSVGQMILSRDFGTTWETMTIPSSYIMAFTATDDLVNMWTGTNGGNGSYSTNSGTSWSTVATSGSVLYMNINQAATRWVALFTSLYSIYTSDGPPLTQTYRPVYIGAANWVRSSISADGSVMAVSATGGEIAISRDGGNTWSSAPSPLGRNSQWNCLAVSGDGNTIYAGGNLTRVYKSTDRGVTFSITGSDTYTASNFYVNGCATNYDGSKVAVISTAYGILLSNNAGSSFSQSLSNAGLLGASPAWQSVTMTSDGSKLAAIPNNATDTITVNTNSGAAGSWTPTSYVLPYLGFDIKSAGDGSVLVASVNQIAPIVSRDWGATWSSITGVGVTINYGLSITSNGNFIAIGPSSTTGSLYYSMDKGVSFTAVPGALTGNMGVAAVAGNGSSLLYGVKGRQLQIMSLALTTKAVFSSLGALATPTFRTSVTLRATLATAGSDGFVTFFANGKKIPGCVKVATVSLVANCTWKPSNRGGIAISATSYPSDNSFTSASINLPVSVGSRSGTR